MIHKKNNILISGPHSKPILLDIFYAGAEDSTPVVIFSHGFKGFKDWGPFNLMAEHFATAGITFIKFNFSHNGTTPDHPEEFYDLEAFGNNNLIIELDDLTAVMDFTVSELKDISSIHLMGHSRGGGISVLKGAEDSRVKKIITLASINRIGTFFSEEEIARWKREGVRYELNSRTGQQMPMYYQYWEAIEQNRSRLDIPHAVKNLEKPLLILHGRNDETIPYEKAKEMHEWNSQMSSLILIDEADHTFGGRHPWKEPKMPSALRLVAEKTIDFIKT